MADHRASSAVASDTSPWRNVRAALRLRPTRGHVVVGLLLFVLGFAVAVQVRSTQEDALSSARTSDLVRILDDLSAQRDRLALETQGLQRDLEELQTGADQSGAARKAARDQLVTLGILAGTLPAEGPGVRVVVTDPTGSVAAADLLDAVQELRDAGAEVLSINDTRVVGSTYLVDTPEGIAVDSVPLQAPYTISAIGDPPTMASALAIPGGVIEQISEAGGQVDVAESSVVTIDAVRPLSYPEYASPE